MIKILFICHGNICRSPMAEFIFKEISKDYKDKLIVDSKAVSREEIGNDIYPPAKDILRKHAIPFNRHSASQMTQSDYEYYDYIIAMEQYNIRNMKRIIDSDLSKVHLLLDFTAESGDIEDPWYSGNFERVFCQIQNGCKGLLNYLIQHGEL